MDNTKLEHCTQEQDLGVWISLTRSMHSQASSKNKQYSAWIHEKALPAKALTPSPPGVHHHHQTYIITTTCTSSPPDVHHHHHMYIITTRRTSSPAHVHHHQHMYIITTTCTSSPPHVHHHQHMYITRTSPPPHVHHHHQTYIYLAIVRSLLGYATQIWAAAPQKIELIKTMAGTGGGCG